MCDCLLFFCMVMDYGLRLSMPLKVLALISKSTPPISVQILPSKKVDKNSLPLCSKEHTHVSLIFNGLFSALCHLPLSASLLYGNCVSNILKYMNKDLQYLKTHLPFM